MEIGKEENGCKGLKRKQPLDIDWEHILPTTSSGDDDQPPELVVTSKDGGGEGDAPTEDLELMSKSEREIMETIARLKKLQALANTLPGKGDKLKANLRRHEDELERRMKLKSADKANKGCEESMQIYDHSDNETRIMSTPMETQARAGSSGVGGSRAGIQNIHKPVGSIANVHVSSLNNTVVKHDELLFSHTSDVKRVNGKITAVCKELSEDYKQKCIQLEAENKFLQRREDELNKKEDELKLQKCKILKDNEKLQLKKRVREMLSSCKQMANVCNPSQKEADDLKNELDALHKRTAELEDQLKVQDEKLQNESMKLEIAYQVIDDEECMDVEETLKNLQRELIEKKNQLQELKNVEKTLTSDFNVKNDELQDARQELIDGLKTNSKRSRIGVKTTD